MVVCPSHAPQGPPEKELPEADKRAAAAAMAKKAVDNLKALREAADDEAAAAADRRKRLNPAKVRRVQKKCLMPCPIRS